MCLGEGALGSLFSLMSFSGSSLGGLEEKSDIVIPDPLWIEVKDACSSIGLDGILFGYPFQLVSLHP